jgi:hypothetical protein
MAAVVPWDQRLSDGPWQHDRGAMPPCALFALRLLLHSKEASSLWEAWKQLGVARRRALAPLNTDRPS